MSSNHSKLCRDGIFGSLQIKSRKVLDRDANLDVQGAKVRGDLVVKGDIRTAAAPKRITQDLMDTNAGVLTITEPGPWALVEDVVGRIVFESDCVCIDLNCHEFDGNGAANAFYVDGYNHILIHNGCVKGAITHICAKNSESVTVCNLEMDGSGIDEQAMLFDTCTDVSVAGCDAKRFLSTIGAVVQFESCEDFALADLSVNQCIKTLQTPAPGGFDPAAEARMRLLSLNGCNNFATQNVNLNHNTSNSSQSLNWFIPFGLTGSNNGFVDKTQINHTQFVGTGPCIGMGYSFFGVCSNVYTHDMQICNTNFQQDCASFIGASSFDFGGLFGPNAGRSSGGLVLDRYNCSDTYVAKMVASPFAVTVLCGTAWGGGAAGNLIKNSKCDRNRVEDGGTANPGMGDFQRICIGMTSFSDVIDSTCNANSMGTSNANSYVAGIHSHMGSIINTQCKGNFGGSFATGIWREVFVPGFGGFEGGVAKFVNCDLSDNAGYGFILLNPIPSAPPDLQPMGGGFNKVEFIGCKISNNGIASGASAGVSLPQLTDPISDILIKDCVITGQYATSGDANGIHIVGAERVTIDHCIVNGTTASGTGHGIHLEDTLTAKIIDCCFDKNDDSGVELSGNVCGVSVLDCVATENDVGFRFDSGAVVTDSMVQDCNALKNATAGFSYDPASAGASFVGNKGQGNGTDFVVASGVLNLQQLTLSAGVYTQVTGSGAVLGSSQANLRIV